MGSSCSTKYDVPQVSKVKFNFPLKGKLKGKFIFSISTANKIYVNKLVI